MRTIEGKLVPIRDHVIVRDMYFGEQKTMSGIIILDDNGVDRGIKPRWGRVYAVGPEQKDVKADDWILMEHGRWTRGFDFEDENGEKFTLRRIDVDAIMLISDTNPEV